MSIYPGSIYFTPCIQLFSTLFCFLSYHTGEFYPLGQFSILFDPSLIFTPCFVLHLQFQISIYLAFIKLLKIKLVFILNSFLFYPKCLFYPLCQIYPFCDNFSFIFYSLPSDCFKLTVFSGLVSNFISKVTITPWVDLV